MSTTNKPYLIVLSGPNGAGKTTFYKQIVSQNMFLADAIFLNYDNEIAALKLLPEYTSKHQEIIEKLNTYIHTLHPAPSVPHWEPFVYKPSAPSKQIRNISSQLRELNTLTARNASTILRKKIQDGFSESKNMIFETTSSAGLIKRNALLHDYDVYGFHICVLEPELSIARVQQRVKNGGHDIPKQIIVQRYEDNITMLPKILPTETAAIVLDNSNKKPFTPIFALHNKHLIDITECPEYLKQTREEILQTISPQPLGELLDVPEHIDIKGLPSDQRKTFIQIMLLNLLGKLKTAGK